MWLPLLRSAGESEAKVCETAGSAAIRNPPPHRKPGKEIKEKDREREGGKEKKRERGEREKIRKSALQHSEVSQIPVREWNCMGLHLARVRGANSWGLNVGRVPIERKLARVPAPRVFPGEPKSLLQANITIDHRSQITDHRRDRRIERENQRESENEI